MWGGNCGTPILKAVTVPLILLCGMARPVWLVLRDKLGTGSLASRRHPLATEDKLGTALVVFAPAANPIAMALIASLPAQEDKLGTALVVFAPAAGPIGTALSVSLLYRLALAGR